MLKLFPDLKRVQVVDFLDVDLRHELSDFADVVQQGATCVALDVRHHALLVRGRVDVPSQLAVEPEATAALVGVAVAAQRRVVEAQELRVGDVQAFFEVADRVVRRWLVVVQLVEHLHPLVVVERRAEVELPVRGKGDVAHTRLAVVHLVKHQPVSQKVKLRGLALIVEVEQSGIPLFQDLMFVLLLFQNHWPIDSSI